MNRFFVFFFFIFLIFLMMFDNYTTASRRQALLDRLDALEREAGDLEAKFRLLTAQAMESERRVRRLERSVGDAPPVPIK